MKTLFKLRSQASALLLFAIALLAMTALAAANPPDPPSGGGGGPYRTPHTGPSAPPPLTPAQQARVNAIMQREAGNLARFEENLLTRIQAQRAASGQQPLDPATLTRLTRQSLQRMASGGRMPCWHGLPEEAPAASIAYRAVRVHEQVEVIAERWVREHPAGGRWDRFVRWMRGDDDDGPPSSGGGGNLASDLALNEIEDTGLPAEKDAAGGMRAPQQRDGVPSEDINDPDNYPSGPGILILPPGGPVPSAPSLPIRVPFRLPVFEPLPLFVNGGGCSCNSSATVASSGRSGPVSGGVSLSTGLRAHIAAGIGDPTPEPTAEPGPGPEGGSPDAGVVPPRSETPLPDGGAGDPDDVVGGVTNINWTQFQRVRGGNRWNNCYRISANTGRGGELRKLTGYARISSTDRGANWEMSAFVAVQYERGENPRSLSARERMTLDATMSFSGQFSRSSPVLRYTDEDLNGIFRIINPERNPVIQSIWLGRDSIPRPEGGETRITASGSTFELDIRANGHPPISASLSRG